MHTFFFDNLSIKLGMLGTSFYREAHGCLLVYDVTNSISLEQLSLWRNEVLSRIEANYLPIIVIGNKTDLRTDENAAYQAGILDWCKENYYGHIETSARDGTGVTAAMQAITILALQYHQMTTHSSRVDSVNTIKLDELYNTPKSNCHICNP